MHAFGFVLASVLGVIGGLAVLMWGLGAIGLGPEDREAEAFLNFDRDRDLR